MQAGNVSRTNWTITRCTNCLTHETKNLVLPLQRFSNHLPSINLLPICTKLSEDTESLMTKNLKINLKSKYKINLEE